MIKKSNIFTINLSQEAIVVLQAIGYLNNLKKSTGVKNLSEFISKLIVNFLKLKYPLKHKEVLMKVLTAQLYEKTEERNKLNDEIDSKSKKLSELKNVGSNIKSN